MLPVEKYENRPDEMEFRIIKKEIEKFMDVVVVRGKTKGKTDCQHFNSPRNSFIFKAEQLSKTIKIMKKNDIVFVMDIWFPIEGIKYVSDMNNLNIKIVALVHAGSWTESDYVAVMEKWAKNIEKGWFNACDLIFVGSEFHKAEIIRKNRIDFRERNKIKVTGFPIDYKELMNYKVDWKRRKNIIVFPHRLTDEKSPIFLTMIADCLKDKGWQIKCTQDKRRTRAEYFKLIANAKVFFSASLQENFGVALRECMALGLYPVVPNNLSYVEIVPKEYRYDNISEATNLIKKVMSADVSFKKIKEKNSVKLILKEIKEMIYG